MRGILKQSTAAKVLVGPLLDAVDGVTPETTWTSEDGEGLIKHEGTSIIDTSGRTHTHVGLGLYNIDLLATDVDTLGLLRFTACDSSVYVPIWEDFLVVDAEAYDLIVSGLLGGLLDATALAKFSTVDTGETTPVAGSVAKLAQGSMSPILGPVTSTINPGNRVNAPVALEMHQESQKVFSITVNDSAGDPVDLSAMTLRFVAHDSNDPTAEVFTIEAVGITVSGTDDEIANVTVTPTESATATDEYLWKLWNVTTASQEEVLQHGTFKIKPAKVS